MYTLRVFTLLTVLVAVVSGAVVGFEKRQDIFDDIASGVTSAFGSFTSNLGVATSGIGSVLDRTRPVETRTIVDAGSTQTVVTRVGSGDAITLATGQSARVTEFAGSTYTVVPENAALSSIGFDTQWGASVLTIALGGLLGVFRTLA